ncbi:methylmalonyl Co-A mutase-associated GTPase MeaB [Breoghania corrubedonensis]|uniref:methylmalonyl Co-A mutase-associated GTPase MeaB n=1 Tax=Breoghania corrubedonensis TaxID=665038 RepID=UPI001FE67CF5|nr:methylmalonyl Co-A mutase-associated GTPase MeaB [Breoghania corrubedonensis]
MTLPERIATIEAVRAGGKPALARALAAIETAEGSDTLAKLLDEATASARAHVLGLTGPPGVGKSTLMRALIAQARAEGRTVAVLAVDPSSQRTGGALLGDRTRLATDPEDDKLFVRSMAARDRLGGLSDHAVAAAVLMRAVADLVIVETVGIGQSEADVASVADTVVLCIQPGSGDSLQFMKAGVMELPDVVAVTKADMGEKARRALADVEGALSLTGARPGGWKAPVVLVSATAGTGLGDLARAIDAHRNWLTDGARLAAHRRRQAHDWIEDALRQRWGRKGLALLGEATLDATRPFNAIRQQDLRLQACWHQP